MKNEAELKTAMMQFGVSRDEAQTVEYLGDGVYASFDGYQVWLRTFDGIRVHDTIAVEPPVIRSLIDYANHFSAVSA